MGILSIPDVVVLKTIDVDVELTIRVHIHVSHEKLYAIPSISPPLEYSQGCILFGTLQVH